jgi:hypothetical protein
LGILIFWLICGGLAAAVAASKNRSGCLWLFLGFVFGPLGLLAVGLMPTVAEEDPDPIESGDRRPCPHCREPIHWDATKCRFCGSAVEPEERKSIGRFRR